MAYSTYLGDGLNPRTFPVFSNTRPVKREIRIQNFDSVDSDFWLLQPPHWADGPAPKPFSKLESVAKEGFSHYRVPKEHIESIKSKYILRSFIDAKGDTVWRILDRKIVNSMSGAPEQVVQFLRNYYYGSKSDITVFGAENSNLLHNRLNELYDVTTDDPIYWCVVINDLSTVMSVPVSGDFFFTDDNLSTLVINTQKRFVMIIPSRNTRSAGKKLSNYAESVLSILDGEVPDKVRFAGNATVVTTNSEECERPEDHMAALQDAVYTSVALKRPVFYSTAHLQRDRVLPAFRKYQNWKNTLPNLFHLATLTCSDPWVDNDEPTDWESWQDGFGSKGQFGNPMFGETWDSNHLYRAVFYDYFISHKIAGQSHPVAEFLPDGLYTRFDAWHAGRTLKAEPQKYLVELLEAYQKITPEEFAKALEKQKELVGNKKAKRFKKWLDASVKKKCKEYQSELKTIDKKLQDYNAELITLERRKIELVSSLPLLEERASNRVSEAITKAYQHPGVLSIEGAKLGDDLALFTKEVFIRDCGVLYRIGRFRVNISMSHNNITFTNLDRTIKGAQDGQRHPHINSEGRPCWGNLSSTINSLIADWNLYGLVLSIWRFLCQANCEDAWGKYLSYFPVVEEDPLTSCILKKAKEMGYIVAGARDPSSLLSNRYRVFENIPKSEIKELLAAPPISREAALAVASEAGKMGSVELSPEEKTKKEEALKNLGISVPADFEDNEALGEEITVAAVETGGPVPAEDPEEEEDDDQYPDDYEADDDEPTDEETENEQEEVPNREEAVTVTFEE